MRKSIFKIIKCKDFSLPFDRETNSSIKELWVQKKKKEMCSTENAGFSRGKVKADKYFLDTTLTELSIKENI